MPDRLPGAPVGAVRAAVDLAGAGTRPRPRDRLQAATALTWRTHSCVMPHTFPNAATGRRGRRPRSRGTAPRFRPDIHLPLALAAPCTPCIPPWITRQYSLNIRVPLKEAVMALPQLPARFGALDAAFLNFECKEMPLHIGGVCVFEGVIPFERFVATIESKLDLIPRYREKVMFPFLNIGYPTWQYDPAFDIRRHIFHVKLDPPGTDEQLRELTGRIFTPLLDRNKPLWETYVVDGLAGGRSAMICKVHHCIVDGVAGKGGVRRGCSPPRAR